MDRIYETARLDKKKTGQEPFLGNFAMGQGYFSMNMQLDMIFLQATSMELKLYSHLTFNQLEIETITQNFDYTLSHYFL